MKTKSSLLAVPLVWEFSSFGSAQVPMTVIERTHHLAEAIKDCDWKAHTLTGAPKGKMLLHRRAMEDVLEQLKTGRDVDPQRLQNALKIHPS